MPDMIPLPEVEALVAKWARLQAECERRLNLLLSAARAFSDAPFDPDGHWTNAEKVALRKLRAAIRDAEVANA